MNGLRNIDAFDPPCMGGMAGTLLEAMQKTVWMAIVVNRNDGQERCAKTKPANANEPIILHTEW